MMKMVDKALFSSKSTEWETPPELFKKYDDIYHFTLDPCASDVNHKCDKYYTKEDDGLSKSWEGEVVWMNPPYGRFVIDKWVEKAHNETEYGECVVIALLPSRTDTKWFHNHVYHSCHIEFLKGRVRFVGAESGAPFPSMVCEYKQRIFLFQNYFSDTLSLYQRTVGTTILK